MSQREGARETDEQTPFEERAEIVLGLNQEYYKEPRRHKKRMILWVIMAVSLGWPVTVLLKS